MSAQAPGSPTLGELVSQLAQKTGVLVSQEVRLAKTELAINVKTAGRNVAWVAIGAFAGMAGALFLLSAVVLLLGKVMPYWLASLIVGGFVVAVGAGAATKGIKALKDLDPAPRETIRTLKEDTAWAKAQLSR
jgi:predicted membrane-bound spermidine synthase